MRVTLVRPWLIAELGRPMRVLSWALNRPGFATAERIVWREVRNADLPPGLDVTAWFTAELAGAGHGAAIGLLTARDIGRHARARAEVEGIRAEALATVGLTNGERVGRRRPGAPGPAGTINIAVTVSAGLTEAALIEALSIAAEARTAAVLAHGPGLAEGRVTGTGTDCIAVAAPPGDEAHAGLHTAVGHALGAAVLDAVTAGVLDWMAERQA